MVVLQYVPAIITFYATAKYCIIAINGAGIVNILVASGGRCQGRPRVWPRPKGYIYNGVAKTASAQLGF